MSIMIVGIAMLMVGSASFAYFDDTETVTGNSFLAGDIDLQLATLGECEMVISFLEIDNYYGVTAPASGWSQNDQTKNLGTSHLDLDVGDAYAYEDTDPDIFSHRSQRGLGICGGEPDEIDTVEGTEKVVIEFDKPEYLNKFEIRSLFNHDTAEFAEVADVDLYLDGNIVEQYDLLGEDPLNSGVGDVVVEIDPEILVDKMVFYVDQNKENSERSEFAVARIWLAPVECNENDLELGAIWTIDDWKPGQKTDGRIWFCDVGTNYGGTLYITCDYTASDPTCEPSDTDCNTGTTPGSTNKFARFMEITNMQYYSADDDTMTTLTIPNTNSNSWVDCQDLKASTLTVPLGANGADGDYLYMELKFHHTAGNDYQGDVFNLEMYFTLEQIMYS